MATVGSPYATGATPGRGASASTSGVRQFRRRVLAVTAAVLAVGMCVLIVVLAVAVPLATPLDLGLLGISVIGHGVVAWTVGRWWEPGGAANVTYVLFNVALVLLAVSQTPTPATDVFWFLLAPVALAAMTLSTRWQVAVTALGVIGYLVASAIGSGIGIGYASQRSVGLVLFAIVMWFLTQRLVEALDAADAARAVLLADVEEMASENQELLRLDTARDDYVSSVSHELRTPLTVILGLTQTLYETWDHLDEERRRHMVGRVAASARGLEGIVSALLDLTRIERGGLRPQLATVQLERAVERCVGRLETVLRHHRLRIEVPADVVVRTDLRLLERVLDNLLTNAARHTPPGTTVTVTAQVLEDRVQVAIRDDGPGIAHGDVARLGQQFFRAGDDPDVEGLGLGLALVVQVLHALGQELEVASELGDGTTFAFHLPRARAAVEQ